MNVWCISCEITLPGSSRKIALAIADTQKKVRRTNHIVNMYIHDLSGSLHEEQ